MTYLANGKRILAYSLSYCISKGAALAKISLWCVIFAVYMYMFFLILQTSGESLYTLAFNNFEDTHTLNGVTQQDVCNRKIQNI